MPIYQHMDRILEFNTYVGGKSASLLRVFAYDHKFRNQFRSLNEILQYLHSLQGRNTSFLWVQRDWDPWQFPYKKASVLGVMIDVYEALAKWEGKIEFIEE
jgi:hypothetical protein